MRGSLRSGVHFAAAQAAVVRLARLGAACAALLGVNACDRVPPAAPALAAKSAPVAATAVTPLKVAFVYVSPVGDFGWTAQHDKGRREMQQALGDRVVSTYVDKVAEGPDAERVIRDLAQQGNRLVFTPSFGYMAPTLKVAAEFPDTVFEHGSGYRMAKNVAVYNARFYEGRYLAGMIAGGMTRTHVIGVVAAFPIPEVIQGINAFTLGARSVDPKVQTRVVWINAWYDPGRERDATNTLLDGGVDVVTHHTDSTAVVAAAEARGKMAVAYHSDMASFGPHAQLVAVTHQWGEFYARTVRSVLDGTWKPTAVWGGLREGMIRLEGMGAAVPAELRERVARREADIREGRFHPFTGPLTANDGRVVLASGAMSDEAMNTMDYFVQGVVGKLPGAP